MFTMDFNCEDLPQHGVVLVPPSSPDYDPLLADILRRGDHLPGGPPIPESMRAQFSEQHRDISAILLNRSPNSIAAIQQAWTFQERTGRTYTRFVRVGSNPAVLLPFGIPENLQKLYGYWHVILPGSKRYLNANGEQLGDNSDVRPPAPDEIWTGGVVGGRGGAGRNRGAMDKVTLTLDGVFFTDGGFAGPNRRSLWEEIVYAAEAHIRVANMARRGHERGRAAEEIIAEIETITGPATPLSGHPRIHRPPSGFSDPEVYRQSALEKIAWQIGRVRMSQGDARTVDVVMGWFDAYVPNFHKLDR